MTEPWRAWSTSHNNCAFRPAVDKWFRASIAALSPPAHSSPVFVESFALAATAANCRIGSAIDKPNHDMPGTGTGLPRRCTTIRHGDRNQGKRYRAVPRQDDKAPKPFLSSGGVAVSRRESSKPNDPAKRCIEPTI